MNVWCVSLVAFLLLSWSQSLFGQQNRVHPRLWQKVQEDGVVTVLVLLNMPWESEGKLGELAIVAQRKAIAANHVRLLAELKGSCSPTIYEIFLKRIFFVAEQLPTADNNRENT